MLAQFPVEISTDIFSYSRIQSFYTFHLVSRHWDTFFHVNESTLYHNAAFLHGFISFKGLSLEDALREPQNENLERPSSWKSFCQQHFAIEKGWLGKGSSSYREFGNAGDTVGWFKVDEEAGYAISSPMNGRHIIVSDLYDRRVLWSLSQDDDDDDDCRLMAYDHNFLVVRVKQNVLDIWCSHDVPRRGYGNMPMNARQALASGLSRDRHGHFQRGHFKPYTSLSSAYGTIHIMSFSYPTLLVVTLEGACLWNIPEAKLLPSKFPTREFIEGEDLRYIQSAHLNSRYVVLGSWRQTRVFSHLGGPHIFCISDTFMNLHMAPKVIFSRTRQSPEPRNVLEKLISKPLLTPAHIDGHFSDAHISCGDILCILRKDGQLMIVELGKLIRGEISLTQAIYQRCILKSKAYDYQPPFAITSDYDKIAVSTAAGITVVTLIPRLQDSLLYETSSDLYPIIAASHFPFHYNNGLGVNECLQFVGRSLFFNWSPSPSPSPSPLYMEDSTISDEDLDKLTYEETEGDSDIYSNSSSIPDLVDEDEDGVAIKHQISTLASITILIS